MTTASANLPARAVACASALAVWLGGCASVPVDAGFAEVRADVASRLGSEVSWLQGSPADRAVAERVQQLLERPLTAESAVQVALLSNRSLQATYEDLGVAQADLVEAGLLSNPGLAVDARFPSRGPAGTNVGIDVVQDFLGLLMMPARKRLATLQFEATRLEVTQTVLHLAKDVRVAFYKLQAALQLQGVITEIARAAEASMEFAISLREAGNLSELEVARQRALREQARIELTRVQAEAIEARSHLGTLLGLWGDAADWTLVEQLPPLPDAPPSLRDLEARAIAQRLDLAAKGVAIQAVEQALGITRDWRLLPFLGVGVSAERDLDGTWVTGPVLELELPVFDRRQGDRRRLEAEARRAHAEAYALAVEIRSEVRSLRDRMVLTRRIAAHYQEVVVPLMQRIVRLSQQHYNFMLVGTFELLSAKRDEIDSYREFVEAVRDYWVLTAELELALGGPIAATAQEPHRYQTRHEGH